MQTIVQPQELIDKVWGKQRIRNNVIYRLMKYVLRIEHDGNVLLHNVVTGRLVVLNQAETNVVCELPKRYDPVFEQLVATHYLVPEDFDEHKEVVNLRNILKLIVDSQSSKDMTYYTILPTTACNARCWYCYEKGITPETMSESTANDVVGFIASRCGGKPVKIRWLGGEPTVAAHRIDQISKGLIDRGIDFISNITTNGYLFDVEMAKRAKDLWHTQQVNISIDGTEKAYNSVKSFQKVRDNPYQRMMRNAELLMEQGINVVIRMNFDQETWTEFPKFLNEARKRFKKYNCWMVYPHQINYDVPQNGREELEDWLNKKNVELSDMAKAQGHFVEKAKVPSLHYLMCEAGDDSCATILPNGDLICCPEQIGSDQVKGNIYQGITNPELSSKWKEFADYQSCRECSLFPYCTRLSRCSSKNRCTAKLLILKSIEEALVSSYILSTNNKIGGNAS